MKEISENLIVSKRTPGEASKSDAAQSAVRESFSGSDIPKETVREKMTRREFIKTLVIFLGGASVFGLSSCGKRETGPDDDIDIEHLPPDFWFKVITNIYERFGEEPSPMQIRAHAIIRALGIPSGQVSALTSTPEEVRTERRTDEIIASRLTNDAGVEILPKHIASSDILDLYPNGLPADLKEGLDPAVREMFEIRYEHAKELYRKYGETHDDEVALEQESYFRLPGGVDLLTVGYTHTEKYQKVHGDYLERLARRASVIAVEKFSDVPYGDSLEIRFEEEFGRSGHYDVFMHRARNAGFRGLFAEVDTRDTRQDLEDFIDCDQKEAPVVFLDIFYEKYLDYIRKEHPALFEEIRTKDRFEELLRRQLTRKHGITYEAFDKSRQFVDHRVVGIDGEYVPDPSGLEFGQMMFGDALSAIKLHLIARLMADGKITSGPILDIQGSGHLSNKSFFIRYPEYAMEVVLRTLPELLSFHGLPEMIVNDLERPDWPEIVRQVAKLAFARTTDDPNNIEPFFCDYLDEYGIDPKEVIPSDDEIGRIMEKTGRGVRNRFGAEVGI